MPITRLPIPALRPFVAMLWAGEPARPESAEPCATPQTIREHVLPTGMMHVVFRLSQRPVRLLEADGVPGETLSESVVGGVRSRYYLREASAPSPSVGVVLRPETARWLLGASAGELAERHTALTDLWGSSALDVHERLQESCSAVERLSVLEAVLMARLPRVRIMHPAIAAAMQAMNATQSVDEAVRRSGYSHRHFIALFREAAGLAPRTYARVRRFQRALKRARSGAADSLAGIAAEIGYSDQAHFNREFLAFSGVSPGAYLRRAPAERNHVPVAASRADAGEVSFVQDGGARPREHRA